MKEAILYEKLKNNQVKCNLCNHRCLIVDGKKGICNVRENQGGILYSLVYGKIVTEHVDPIEKKPLYKFMPGTETYSIATVGCNYRCLHCQNYDISQFPRFESGIPGNLRTAEEIVESAIKDKCPSISYTYSEPTIMIEFALECMKLAHEKGLKNIWVSNGYMTPESLKLIMPYLDAINIDLKFLNEKISMQVCGAKVQPVLENLITLKKNNVHLEITTLIIPGYTDKGPQVKDIAKFIVQNLGADTPWHISRFFPAFQLNVDMTTIDLLKKAEKIGRKEGLKNIYLGNV